MTSSLASRLGDIPGVASVVIDLDGFGRGIDVRLEPGADEGVVMEKLRALLAAYGIRHERRESSRRAESGGRQSAVGVDVMVTPADGSVRIEVATGYVRSFRIVAADPISVAQGLADAWCQVIGRKPVEIVSVEVDESDQLRVVASDGEHESSGAASVSEGWVDALTSAVGGLFADAEKTDLERAAS